QRGPSPRYRTRNASWDENYDEYEFFDAEESEKLGDKFSNSNGENAAPKPIHRISADALKMEYREKKNQLAKAEKERKERVKEEEKATKERLREQERAEKEHVKEEEKVNKAEKKELEQLEKEKVKELEQAEKKKKSEEEKERKQEAAEAEVNRGEGQSGEGKEVLAGEISAKLAQLGKTGRTAAAVKAKIGRLEKDYRNTRDWKANTGNRILNNTLIDAESRESQVGAQVKQACPHFDLLDPIFGD
ncbi:hypothetical protein HDU78_011645, partial [Chytriomyces hyalinus]